MPEIRPPVELEVIDCNSAIRLDDDAKSTKSVRSVRSARSAKSAEKSEKKPDES